MHRAALVIAVSLAAFGGLPLHAESAQPAPAAAPSLPAISVSTVGTRVLRDRVISSGLVGPVERVQVQPWIEGQPIDALLADVGDTVVAGQVLARLSTTALELQKSQLLASMASAKASVAQGEAQLLDARATADEAGKSSARARELLARGNGTQAQADQSFAIAQSAKARVSAAEQGLEAAKAQIVLVEAQLANIELQLSRTEVKAPVGGEIITRNAQVGAVASAAGQPMFVLIRDGALEMNADIPESELVRLKPGQTVTMRAVGAAAPLTGTVRLVEPTIDTATRLGRARITINERDKVVTGMFIDAEIMVTEREGVAVPVTAIGSAPTGTTVMKVTDGTVSRVKVKTGIRDGGWIEILEGIAPGDTVVTKAGAFVRDGDRINPVPVATN